ncbi:MAG TPA: hypothetical protein VF763_06595 [Candidatus Limnocylindrales bacterium]
MRPKLATLARSTVASALVIGLLMSIASTRVLASSGPDHFGPFENSYSFIGFDCPGFDIRIDGAGTDE